MRWAELRMCRFWAGGISSFPFSRAREYRLLRRLTTDKCTRLMHVVVAKVTLNSFHIYNTLLDFDPRSFPAVVS